VCRRTEGARASGGQSPLWIRFPPEATFLNFEGKIHMNAKIVTTCLLAGALAMPIAGYTADGDTDRSSPKAFVKDSVITTKVKAELAEEKISSLVKIKVDTDAKGAVSLSGTAANQAAIDKAVAIARGVKGVTSVQNDIKIQADK
jgi:hyperosmotically inducible periplasmic protein